MTRPCVILRIYVEKVQAMIYEHIDGVSVAAQFEWENGLHYRYRLEINLKSAPRNGKSVCVVMQNPSYAGEDVADKSVQFMEKVVFMKGLPEFEGVRRLIVINQYAYIQTRDFQGLPELIGPKNDDVIAQALSDTDIVILAWGSANRYRDRQAYVLGLLERMKKKTIYRTRMHPSRGRYKGFIQPFDDGTSGFTLPHQT